MCGELWSGSFAEDGALVSVFSHGDAEVEDDGDGAASGRCPPSGQRLPLQLLRPPLNATTDWLASQLAS